MSADCTHYTSLFPSEKCCKCCQKYVILFLLKIAVVSVFFFILCFLCRYWKWTQNTHLWGFKRREMCFSGSVCFCCLPVCVCTWIGKHGVSLLQVRMQSAPLLKEAVLGLWGVRAKSWSIHCPHSTNKWERDTSREMFSFWVYKTSWDTVRTYTKRQMRRLNNEHNTIVTMYNVLQCL